MQSGKICFHFFVFKITFLGGMPPFSTISVNHFISIIVEPNAQIRGCAVGAVPWIFLLAAGITRNFLWLQNLTPLGTLLTTRVNLIISTRPVQGLL